MLRSVVLLALLAVVLAGCFGGRKAASQGAGEQGPPQSAKLMRLLHFPRVAGARCPASRGRYVATPTVSGIALGSGPVRVFINNPGDLRHGMAHLASTDVPGWLALKTHFFSVPAYHGPFLVRAQRLDDSGPIRLGARPTQTAPLRVPSGPAANGLAGWREFPYSTFVKAPGCYAWQVDGLTFSKTIIVRMLPKLDG
jgi:hypothetical protein